jgi:hypothetical protein
MDMVSSNKYKWMLRYGHEPVTYVDGTPDIRPIETEFPHVEWEPLRAFLEGDSDSGVYICVTYTVFQCKEAMDNYPDKTSEEQDAAYWRYVNAENAERYYNRYQDNSTVEVIRAYLRRVWAEPF